MVVDCTDVVLDFEEVEEVVECTDVVLVLVGGGGAAEPM